MIQVTQGGMSMTYRADDGSSVVVSIFDQARFKTLSDRRDAQVQIEAVNTAMRSKYLADLHNFQVLLDSGRATPADAAPVKPKRKLLSDTGVAGEEEFADLPVPVYPMTYAPSPTGALHPVDDSAAPLPELLVKVLMSMSDTLQKIAAKVGA